MLKKFVKATGLLAAAGAFAMTGPAVAEERTVCFVTFSLQIAYFQSSVAGGKKAAEELGVELVVLDPQADAGRQVTQVEDCISRNVDAIVVDPIESSSLIGVIAEAGARNIPVATPGHEGRQPACRYADRRTAVRGLLHFRSVRCRLDHWQARRNREDRHHARVHRGAACPPRRFRRCPEGGSGGGSGRDRGRTQHSRALDGGSGGHADREPRHQRHLRTGDPSLQGGLAAAEAQGRDIAFFGWDDIPEPFIKPLEDGRIVGFLKQKPSVGGEMAVRLLVDHLAGKEITSPVQLQPGRGDHLQPGQLPVV